jgi:hypothetical protein
LRLRICLWLGGWGLRGWALGLGLRFGLLQRQPLLVVLLHLQLLVQRNGDVLHRASGRVGDGLQHRLLVSVG